MFSSPVFATRLLSDQEQCQIAMTQKPLKTKVLPL